MSSRPLSPAVREMARRATPDALRAPARRVAERRGWVLPAAPSPDDDPLDYPYREIVAHHDTFSPQYLWGTLCGAGLARALGEPRITVIELGVAGGNGLVALERIAAWVARRSGVSIDVVGFDTGAGLPPPTDHRDSPNLWREGFFAMDVAALQARLDRARLALGPVKETIAEFLRGEPAPVAFVAFDLDLYSSTADALALFRGAAEVTLPRVVCYFDDIVGFSHGDFTGERLAIAEYNREREDRKLSPLYGLRWILEQDRAWTEMMFMYHCFGHPRYNDPDGTQPHRELPLAR